jgi:hypothetical protein
MRKLFKYIAIGIFLISICTPALALELTRQKNTATVISFPIINSTGSVIPNATGITSQYSYWSDGTLPSNFTNTASSPVQIQYSGRYSLNLTAAEINYTYCYIKVTATSALDEDILIRMIIGNPADIATTASTDATNATVNTINDTVNAANASIILINTSAANANTSAYQCNITEGLQNATWTSAKAAFLDFALSTINANLTTLTTIETNQNNTWTSAKAGYLDIAVSSRANGTDYNVTRAANLDNLDELISSRMATFTYTAPDNANITAIKAKTDNLTFTTANKVDARAFTVDDKTGYSLTGNQTINITGSLSGSVGSVTGAVGSVTNLVNITQSAADLIWNTTRTGHTGAGTFGLYLDAQVSTIGGGNLTEQTIWEYSSRSLTDGVTVTTNNDKTGYRLSSTGIDEVWDELSVSHNTTGSFSELLNGKKDANGNYSDLENLIRVHR